MIGAMPAVAVRHERRKKHKKDKRPKKLLLKPYQGQQDGAMSPTGGHASRAGSRVGSPTHGNNHNGMFSILITNYIYIQMMKKIYKLRPIVHNVLHSVYLIRR